MRWFSNMRIGKKLALGFGMVLVLMVGISALEISASLSMDAGYSYIEEYPSQQRVLWSEVESNFHAARRSVSHSGFFYGRDGHDANVAAMRQAYDRDVATLYDDLSAIRESVQNDLWLMESDKDAMIKSVDDIKAAIDNWREVVADPVINAFAAGDRDTAISIMEANSSIIDGVQENIIANYDEATRLANENSAMMDASVKEGVILIIGLAAAVVIIGILIAIANTRAITKPINRLVAIVGEVAEGKLNVNIDRNSISKDEIGTLTMGIATLADTILLIVAEIGNLDAEFAAGDIEAQIDTSKFKGSYKEVAEGINATLNELIHEEIVFMNCLIEFGKGNFSADIPKLPGKKVLMNQNIDALRANFKNVADEINTLVGAAGRGELDKRVDISKYSGDWALLLDGLNDLMVAIADPIREANRILNNLAAGDFEHHMHGNYKGDFLMIKNSVNETVTHISSYIKEISAVLGALADNNLNQNITREYVGDFSSIKKSLLNIIKNFNEVISRIYAASDQVASGAHAVSEGSTSMAQGASEQASSIEELNATVQLISESTQQNAQNAGDADALSKQSKDMAALGDDDMNHMLKSMDGIKASSDGISKIIKVIDDIAFQTNILSLNAAVEAARAGEHGKGFAVVAEEVRNLAVRSQSSARDTAQLIEESISRVNEGMAIAGKTAEALRQIVESVTKVSGIIEGITQASQEQSSAILQVMDGIRQITGVIQNNSSTTEEAASAAEELSSQSEVLRNLVSVFTLRA